MKPVYKKRYPHLFEPMIIQRGDKTFRFNNRALDPAQQVGVKTAMAALILLVLNTGCVIFKVVSRLYVCLWKCQSMVAMSICSTVILRPAIR